MGKPLADYECTNCAEEFNEPSITAILHQDLPNDAKFCPQCGSNKGFTKVFLKVNVIGSQERQAQKVIDAALAPIHQKHADTKSGATRFERAGQEAMAKAYEQAPAAERAQMEATGGKNFGARVMPAGQAISMIDGGARMDTRECVFPALTGRQVRPQWQK